MFADTRMEKAKLTASNIATLIAWQIVLDAIDREPDEETKAYLNERLKEMFKDPLCAEA
tara:strand:+ start:140 stop:316 length:177 start_codon:yes stop_codon:yes gene_type:complete